MKRRTFGTILILMGVLFLGAALALVIKNLWEEKNAENTSLEVMESLMENFYQDMESVSGDEQDKDSNLLGPSVENTSMILPENPSQIEIPDYILNPKMDMPEQKVDGIPYIGYLQIEALGLQLPIASKTTYPYLKKVPCRYEGSAYLDNLVIGAHNYKRHFGGIGKLSYGDVITFTDMDGNAFSYEVATIEILQPSQVDDLCSGEWPLTLYTCTIGGKTRVVVRCEKIE